MKECIGLLGAIFGHNFQARYSTVLPRGLKIKSAYDIEPFKNKIYLGDVCKRCGQVRNGIYSDPNKEELL